MAEPNALDYFLDLFTFGAARASGCGLSAFSLALVWPW